MGTPSPLLWSALLLLVAAVPSGAAAEATVVPFAEGAPMVDGMGDDGYWTGIKEYTWPANGRLDPEVTRDLKVKYAHNGTHLFLRVIHPTHSGTEDGDFVFLTFDPEDGGGMPDALHEGWTEPLDQVWRDGAWRDDASNDCTTTGEAARRDVDGAWHWEIGKVLDGDDCDLALGPTDLFHLRLEVRENRPFPHGSNSYGDNFRWPTDTSASASTSDAWRLFTLEATGGPGEDGEGGDGDGDADRNGTDGDNQTGGRDADDGGPTGDGDDRGGDGGTDGAGDDTSPEENPEAPLPLGGVLLSLVLCALWAGGRRRP